MKNYKQLFLDDPEITALLEQRQQNKIKKEAEASDVNTMFKDVLDILKKGEKGEPGESIVGPMGPQGIPGVGKDGKDGKSIVGPTGPKGEKGDRGESVVGPAGVDGVSPSIAQIIEGIKNLTDKEAESFGKAMGAKMDISYIRNSQSFLYNGKKYKFEELMHGGGSASGSGYQVPTGTVNGINNIFTFTTAPNAISVDGISFNQISSDGTVNWTGSKIITLTVAPNFSIFGIA